MFISVSWGFMRPLVKNGEISVKLQARLTTGEKLIVKSSIVVVDDHHYFESMVPGVVTHVQDRSTWNVIREKI